MTGEDLIEIATQPFLVGIVGGIASGKSAVAKRLAECGAIRISADEIGHELLETEPSIRERVVALLGTDVITAKGSMNRSAIATKVFGSDAKAIENRRGLEAILHPAIRAETERRLKKIAVEAPHSIVILDAPLLVEAGWLSRCDEVVFVDRPVELRQKLAEQRGWPVEELARREANQASLDEKRRVSTTTVRNDGNLDELFVQVDELYRLLEYRVKSHSSL